MRCRLLAGVTALAGTASAARADDAAGVASSRMSYSRFLEYLEMGRVKKVGRLGHGAGAGLAECGCVAWVGWGAPILLRRWCWWWVIVLHVTR